MRTTIRLDDALMREAKLRAAESGTTLTALIEDALRERLHRAASKPRNRPPLPSFGDPADTFPLPGVDLDDSAHLLELMEEGLPLDKRR